MNIRIVLLRLSVLLLIALLGPVGSGNTAFDRQQVSMGVIYVQPVSGIQTTESGGTGTFTIRLGSKPHNAVKIKLKSSNKNEGQIDPDQVAIGPGEWNLNHPITITGVDDNRVDGDVTYTIITEPAKSNDVNFDKVNPADVMAINLDNDVSAKETPQANDDTGMTQQGSPVIIDVLANDNGLGDKPLAVTVAQNPAQGAAQVLSNKRIAYTPNTNFYGTDIFGYQVCDKDHECSLAGVTITVQRVNHTPNAANDSALAIVNTQVTIDVLANDSDPDGDPIWLGGFDSTSTNGGTIARDTNSTPANLGDDRLIYTSSAGFSGADRFYYTISDGALNSRAEVSVSVSKPNSSPVANNDLYSTEQGTAILVPASTGVLSNDSDLEGSSLATQLRSSPTNGTLQLLPDGSFTYTPQPAFIGTDTFTYRASDGLLNSNTATATILVIDKQIPTVVWLAPVADGQVYYVKDETVILRVDATDNQGIASVRFVRWDGNQQRFVDIGVSTTAPYEVALDTTTLNLDWNQIFAIAYDNQGNDSLRQFIWIFRLGGSAPLIFLPSINH